MMLPVTDHNDSAFVMHIPCTECGSKDNCGLFDDDHSYCFGCQAYTPGDDAKGTTVSTPKKINKDLIHGHYAALVARGIREDTCRKFDYQVGELFGRPVQIENYRNEFGEVVAQKTRDKDKNFTALGETKQMGLFGQHLWTTGNRTNGL